MLRGLNQKFYHQTVTSLEIEQYINKITGIDFTPVFNQYLRSTDIPVLEYKFEDKSFSYRWTNCNPDFNLPLRVDVGGEKWLKPTTEWKKERLSREVKPELQVDKNFYVGNRNVGSNS
jgi:aminopeptidase N